MARLKYFVRRKDGPTFSDPKCWGPALGEPKVLNRGWNR